jgi:hypothetical protein
VTQSKSEEQAKKFVRVAIQEESDEEEDTTIKTDTKPNEASPAHDSDKENNQT